MLPDLPAAALLLAFAFASPCGKAQAASNVVTSADASPLVAAAGREADPPGTLNPPGENQPSLGEFSGTFQPALGGVGFDIQTGKLKEITLTDLANYTGLLRGDFKLVPGFGPKVVVSPDGAEAEAGVAYSASVLAEASTTAVILPLARAGNLKFSLRVFAVSGTAELNTRAPALWLGERAAEGSINMIDALYRSAGFGSVGQFLY